MTTQKRRICKRKNCRKEFTPKTEWQKYCRPPCRQAENYEARVKLLRRAQKIVESQEQGAA